MATMNYQRQRRLDLVRSRKQSSELTLVEALKQEVKTLQREVEKLKREGEHIKRSYEVRQRELDARERRLTRLAWDKKLGAYSSR